MSKEHYIVPTPRPPELCDFEAKLCRHPNANKVIRSMIKIPNPAYTGKLKQDLYCTPCMRLRLVKALESIAAETVDSDFK